MGAGILYQQKRNLHCRFLYSWCKRDSKHAPVFPKLSVLGLEPTCTQHQHVTEIPVVYFFPKPVCTHTEEIQGDLGLVLRPVVDAWQETASDGA